MTLDLSGSMTDEFPTFTLTPFSASHQTQATLAILDIYCNISIMSLLGKRSFSASTSSSECLPHPGTSVRSPLHTHGPILHDHQDAIRSTFCNQPKSLLQKLFRAAYDIIWVEDRNGSFQVPEQDMFYGVLRSLDIKFRLCEKVNEKRRKLVDEQENISAKSKLDLDRLSPCWPSRQALRRIRKAQLRKTELSLCGLLPKVCKFSSLF